MAVAWAILGATVFDLLYMLFRRFDIDCGIGEEFPDRWIAWGTRESWRYDQSYPVRYFLLRLPSWQWIRDYLRGPDAWCWGQLTLLRYEGQWHAEYWRVG